MNQQKIKILDPKSFSTQLSLLNLPNDFKNTVMFYMNQLQQTQITIQTLAMTAMKAMDDNKINEIVISKDEQVRLSKTFTLDANKLDDESINIVLNKTSKLEIV